MTKIDQLREYWKAKDIKDIVKYSQSMPIKIQMGLVHVSSAFGPSGLQFGLAMGCMAVDLAHDYWGVGELSGESMLDPEDVPEVFAEHYGGVIYCAERAEESPLFDIKVEEVKIAMINLILMLGGES